MGDKETHLVLHIILYREPNQHILTSSNFIYNLLVSPLSMEYKLCDRNLKTLIRR
jgi:hypothetical protein